MTIHGIGFGLDETESAYAQLGGILDAFRESHFPKQLKRISIVDKNEDRVIRLRKVFDKILSNSDFAFKSESEEKWSYNINPNFWSKKSSILSQRSLSNLKIAILLVLKRLILLVFKLGISLLFL